MSKSAIQLRALRQWLGMSQFELGRELNLSHSIISDTEDEKVKPHSRIRSWLKRSQKIVRQEQARREAALRHHFDIKCCYLIDTHNFCYIGKQGIHHCFKAVLGGWSRTYTDTQLIGKSILEVNDK